MKCTVTCEDTVPAAPHAVWNVWSDLNSYPDWDPREELNELDGSLQPGVKGRFRQRGGRSGDYVIDAVAAGTSWTSSSPLPGGRLVISHEVAPANEGTRVVKTYTATGPMAIAFRLFFASGIRKEMPESFSALKAEVQRRGA